MVQQHAPVVLVIDDEDYVADMIAAALELEGYRVDVAYNGRDGLEIAKKSQFALVVVDIMMPYMSGLELIARLRDHEDGRRVPIVLISAGARPQAALEHVAFLPKPFNVDRLIELISERIGSPKRGPYES